MKLEILVCGEKPEERLARLKKEVAEKRAREAEEARQNKIQDALNSRPKNDGSTIQNTTEGLETKIGPYNTRMLNSPSEYFIAPGRFNVQHVDSISIGQTRKPYYRFEGLELPMGKWDYLLLDTQRDMQSLKFDQWTEQNKGSEGVIPISILYGLMVVCYKNRSMIDGGNRMSQIKDTLLVTDINSCAYSSTIVSYREDKQPIVTIGAGWQQESPFAVSYITDITGNSWTLDPHEEKGVKEVSKTLLSLLGETNLERAQKVIRWASGSTENPQLLRNRIYHSDAAVVIGCRSPNWGPHISLTEDPNSERPARKISTSIGTYQKK